MLPRSEKSQKSVTYYLNWLLRWQVKSALKNKKGEYFRGWGGGRGYPEDVIAVQLFQLFRTYHSTRWKNPKTFNLDFSLFENFFVKLGTFQYTTISKLDYLDANQINGNLRFDYAVFSTGFTFLLKRMVHLRARCHMRFHILFSIIKSVN